jgi:hypothetical protein
MIERTAAIVENGIVTNVIVITAEHELTENEIEYTADKPAGIGWEYDGVNFIAPPEPEPEVLEP